MEAPIYLRIVSGIKDLSCSHHRSMFKPSDRLFLSFFKKMHMKMAISDKSEAEGWRMSKCTKLTGIQEIVNITLQPTIARVHLQ